MKRALGSLTGGGRQQIPQGISPCRTVINLSTAQAAPPGSSEPQFDSPDITRHLLVLLLLPSFQYLRILFKITQN